MKQIELDDYVAVLAAQRKPYHASYFAMYSSLLGGVVTDPILMQLPLDDHLVHRGDGVFETCKCVTGAIYNLDAHLARLERSASAIGIHWKAGIGNVRDLSIQTAHIAKRPECCIRIILARGPGGFGVSPYESPVPALYIVAYKAPEPFMKTHPEGATLRRSTIPCKPSEFAGIKNCNYLPNVLMKRECVDWGVDFVVGYDASGFLAEGPTENMGIVTRKSELVFPRLENILAGTTMLRVVELAETMKADGQLKDIQFRDIAEQEVRSAAEVLVLNTTTYVAAVRSYEGQPIGDGKPGRVWRRLSELLDLDVRCNPAMRTMVCS